MKFLVIPAMLAVAALGLAGCGGEGRGPMALPGTATPSAAATPSNPCPPPVVPEPDTRSVTALPAGAVGVRLCSLAYARSTLAPEDELTTGVDRLVTQFNGAEGVDFVSMVPCPVDLGPSYAMVFRYPDGRVVTVSSMLAGCHTVGGKFGGQELLDTFVALLAEQRQATPPKPVELRTCEGPEGSWMPVALGDLVTISRCARFGEDGDRVRTASADQWATLHADLIRSAGSGNYPDSPGKAVRFEAADALGQPVTLSRFGDTVVVHNERVGSRTPPTIWKPSPEALAILDQLGR
ncbi:hypothetical protein AADG42_02785 [Ammonicoccus fulvus]|uniref:Lipoprotein n=1 Tax=Ammonicoccus fulvus TaxID=3138240 RepID=A0ABZ3FNC3_9ACTN